MNTKKFFEIVENPHIFDFKDYNLFKLFYKSFLYRQSKKLHQARKPAARPRRSSMWVLVWSFVRSLAIAVYLGILSRVSRRTLFYGASGRHSVIEDMTYDLYNGRIVGQKGRKQFIIIEDYDDGAIKQYRPDLYLDAFALLDRQLRRFIRRVFARDLQRYAQSIVHAYPELGFSEAHIKHQVVKFYTRFFVNRFLLALLAPERVFLICHYGREHFIAACKRKRIQVVELMHSSIPRTHHYYNYTESYGDLFHKGIFPDELAVFGEYWKQVVLRGNMFPAESIIVVGYYLCIPDGLEKLASRKKQIILVSSQWTVQQELCDYISFLISALNPVKWRIIIKPHPAEDHRAYIRLIRPGFISLSNQNVYELLAQSDVHISVYSGVLYEAIRYDVRNYVLLVDRYISHYNEIIESGAALPLFPNQLPSHSSSRKPSLIISQYFADYDPSRLFKS